MCNEQPKNTKQLITKTLSPKAMGTPLSLRGTRPDSYPGREMSSCYEGSYTNTTPKSQVAARHAPNCYRDAK